MPDKIFAFDEWELGPDDFTRHPVWMHAHGFDADVLVRTYGPFSKRPTECARAAYLGKLPYLLLDEEHEHPSCVFVRCRVVTAAETEFEGYLSPAWPDGDPVSLNPQVFALDIII